MAGVEVQTKRLQAALKVVKPAIEVKGTIPFLRTVRLQRVDGGTAISATNLKLSVRVRVNEDEPLGDPLNISSERLLSWIPLQEGEKVTITPDKKGYARLQSGRAKAVLPTVDGAPQFEAPAKGQQIVFFEGALLRALGHVLFAASDEAAKPAFECVHMRVTEDRVKFATTNGSRMAIYEIPGTPGKLETLIAPELAKALLVALVDREQHCTMTVGENKVGFTLDNCSTEIYTQNVVAQFPAYERIIPPARRRFTINAPALLKSVQRVMAVSDATSRYIDITFTPTGLQLAAADSKAGEAADEISVEVPVSENFVQRFSSVYLADALKHLKDDVLVDFGDEPNLPFMFKAKPAEGEEFTYVVMPMDRGVRRK